MGRIIVIIVAALILGAPARAQGSGVNMYEYRMTDIAGALGALHHLRPLCRPRDGDRWRDYMKELMDLDKPSKRQARAMTNAFNEAYHKAETSFPRCTPQARQEARFHADTATLAMNALLASFAP